MKIKQIKYVCGDSPQHLQDLVQIMLDRGWCINGTIIKDGGNYLQMMFMPAKITEMKTVVGKEGVDTDAEFTKMFREDYVLHGHPFVVDGYLCQSMVRSE